MTKGRRAFGVKKKTKRDLTHFKKKTKKTKEEVGREELTKLGHPSIRKTIEKKLKKPRSHE